MDTPPQRHAPFWFWIPEREWLAIPERRVTCTCRLDPLLPTAKLVLCYLCSSWKPIFVQEEIINGESYSPNRSDNRVLTPLGHQASLQAKKNEYVQLKLNLVSEALDPWNGRETIPAFFYHDQPALKHHRALSRKKAAVPVKSRFPAQMNIPFEERQIKCDQVTENRKLDKELAQRHPKGHLIGGTQTQGYKSAQTNVRWGTKQVRKS